MRFRSPVFLPILLQLLVVPVLADTRALIQGFLSTPWADAFNEAAKSRVPYELQRLQDVREYSADPAASRRVDGP